MRVPTVLCLVTLATIILICAEVVEGKKNNNNNNNNNRRQNKTKNANNGGKGGKKNTVATGNCSVVARDLNSLGGLKCRDNESVIADLSFIGRNGTCQGLTPQLFVQTANCMWNNYCNLTYNSSVINYMIKLHAGPDSCVVRAPEHFDFNFSCAKNGSIKDVIPEDGVPRKYSSASGILRSHAQHPWHYRQSQHFAVYNVTLEKPSGAGSRLCFTFRKYHLSHGDSLEIGSWHSNKNETMGKTHCLPGSEDVRVSLVLSYLSHGAEGFLLCYSWEAKETSSDMCSKLLSLESCPAPTPVTTKSPADRTTGKPGRKGGKGGKGGKPKRTTPATRSS